MKRLKTSDGKAVSLGNSARRVRSGTHADALQYTDDDAGDLMAVPFTEEEIGHWRNAKNLSYGTFTSMASVEEACKAVQVACFLDDQSPTINSLAAKLLDACIFEYPGLSKKDTFNLCTKSADILKAVFSSKRICDASQMAQLIHTLYESLGFEISVDFPYPECQKYSVPPHSVGEQASWEIRLHDFGFMHSCQYFNWLLLQFDPSNFSEEYGIKRDARGLAGHAEVQTKWADFVKSSQGFDEERRDICAALSEFFSKSFSDSAKMTLESFCFKMSHTPSNSHHPLVLDWENDKDDAQRMISKVEALTSWEAVPEDFIHHRAFVDAILGTRQTRARRQAAFAFNIAVLTPIMDAQLAVGPKDGVLVLIYNKSDVEIHIGALHPGLTSGDCELGKVMSSVAWLMGTDLRSLTNLKVVKDGCTSYSDNKPRKIFTRDGANLRVSEGVQVLKRCRCVDGGGRNCYLWGPKKDKSRFATCSGCAKDK